jgi:ABC-type sugar transport system ATPase subunit
MSLIRFENVSHYYQKERALTDLNFEVEDLKITAVIGRSGSGKSTLLQIINGLVRPSDGVFSLVKTDYKILIRPPDRVFGAGYRAFPHMNVYSNISLGKLQGSWRLLPN